MFGGAHDVVIELEVKGFRTRPGPAQWRRYIDAALEGLPPRSTKEATRTKIERAEAMTWVAGLGKIAERGRAGTCVRGARAKAEREKQERQHSALGTKPPDLFQFAMDQSLGCYTCGEIQAEFCKDAIVAVADTKEWLQFFIK